MTKAYTPAVSIPCERSAREAPVALETVSCTPGILYDVGIRSLRAEDNQYLYMICKHETRDTLANAFCDITRKIKGRNRLLIIV